MNFRNLVKRVQVFLSILFLIGVSMAASGASSMTRPAALEKDGNRDVQGGQSCRCGKVHPGLGGRVGCTPPLSEAPLNLVGPFGLGLHTDKGAGLDAEYRQVSVASLVKRALTDQRVMLQKKVGELERWNARDQGVFAKWYGTTDEQARRLIHARVLRMLELNKNYSVQNFRRAQEHRDGVYAYVYPNQPARVYVDDLFVTQVPTGENSRAGTISHEMSHFVIVGNTFDHKYGTDDCKALARKDAQLALENADSQEFWLEGAN